MLNASDDIYRCIRHRDASLRVRLGIDEIPQSLYLGQIQPPAFEGAPSELSWLSRAAVR